MLADDLGLYDRQQPEGQERICEWRPEAVRDRGHERTLTPPHLQRINRAIDMRVNSSIYAPGRSPIRVPTTRRCAGISVGERSIEGPREAPYETRSHPRHRLGQRRRRRRIDR